MDPFCAEGRNRDPSERRKLMKKEKHEKTTVTVRLTDEEDQVLSRLCTLKKTSKTGYLARLAKDQAKRELLNYAAEEYLEGNASLSELAKKTGLDVPTIMDEVASIKGQDRRAVEAFLSAVETLSKLNNDPEFYNLAVNAVRE
jgi:predicted transcriptional regulator